MAFWSHPKNLIPKQSHRWIVSFDAGYGQENDGDVLPHYIFKSIDRPSVEVGVIQAKHLYSQTFNFPKRVTWKPIKVELNDVVISGPRITMPGNKVSRANSRDEYLKSSESFIYSVLLKGGYFAINKLAKIDENILLKKYTFKDDLTNALFKDYRTSTEKQITIKELSPDGHARESWILHNPFINNINFGRLDYSSDNVVTISFDIVYDWAEFFSKPLKIDTSPQTFGGPFSLQGSSLQINGKQITVDEYIELLKQNPGRVEVLSQEQIARFSAGEQDKLSQALAGVTATNPPQTQTVASPPPQPTPTKPSEVTGDPTGGLGPPIPSKPGNLDIGPLTGNTVITISQGSVQVSNEAITQPATNETRSQTPPPAPAQQGNTTNESLAPPAPNGAPPPARSGGMQNSTTQFIGDSIARGAAGLSDRGSEQDLAMVGRSSRQVIETLNQNISSLQESGGVVLSTGTANTLGGIKYADDPGANQRVEMAINDVQREIQILRDAGIQDVTVLGISNQQDQAYGGGINERIRQIVENANYTFQGGFQAGRDNIHPNQEYYSPFVSRRTR